MKKDATHFTIGGIEYPINVSFEHQYYSMEKYPKEKLENMTMVQQYDYTLDMIMQLLADPKPFNSVDELRRALTPREFRAIDTSISYIIFDMDDPNDDKAEEEKTPGKQN